MKVLDNICDILEDELKEIARNGQMTPQVLENTYKAVDIIKDITTIKAMQESGYSNSYYDDYSMDMRRSYYPEREYQHYRNGYSREADKEHLERKMEEIKRQLDNMK